MMRHPQFAVLATAGLLFVSGCAMHGVPATAPSHSGTQSIISTHPDAGRFASSNFSEFKIPTHRSQPNGITLGPDSAIWFTEHLANKIGRVDSSGVFTEFAIPTANSRPVAIVTGPDGNLWFTENADKVGKVTTAGVFTEYQMPLHSEPGDIAVGPDGNLWFTEIYRNRIGKLTTSGALTEYKLPAPSKKPSFITTGPDNNVWFTEIAGNNIGRITPSGRIKEYPLPTPNSLPSGIANSDGVLWVCEFNKSVIARIDPNTGSILEFPTVTPNAGPLDIVSGPSDDPTGAIYFTEQSANNIASISKMNGAVTEVAMPTAGVQPFFLTVGADSDLWISEVKGNNIARYFGI
jgi:virginiamycin B lyase